MTARSWRETTPALAAVFLRGSQLVLLAALGYLLQGGDLERGVLALGVVSAFGVFAESGATQFVLSLQRDTVTQSTLSSANRVQFVFGGAAAGASLLYLYLFVAHAASMTVQVLGCAFALTMLLENQLRVSRSIFLVHALPLRYALMDVAGGSWKLLVVGVATALSQPMLLAALPLGPALIMVTSVRAIHGLVSTKPGALVHAKDVAPFALNGAASALYSQSPLIIAGAILGPGASAVLAVSYRLAQSTEIMPATVSQQILTRVVRDRSLDQRRPVVLLGVLGCVVGIALALATPLLSATMGLRGSLVAGLVIATSVPLKFANYGLSAIVLGRGGIMTKLKLTVVVGVAALGLAPVLSVLGGSVGVASMTLTAEFVLLCLLIVASGRRA